MLILVISSWKHQLIPIRLLLIRTGAFICSRDYLDVMVPHLRWPFSLPWLCTPLPKLMRVDTHCQTLGSDNRWRKFCPVASFIPPHTGQQNLQKQQTDMLLGSWWDYSTFSSLCLLLILWNTPIRNLVANAYYGQHTYEIWPNGPSWKTGLYTSLGRPMSWTRSQDPIKEVKILDEVEQGAITGHFYCSPLLLCFCWEATTNQQRPRQYNCLKKVQTTQVQQTSNSWYSIDQLSICNVDL